VDYLLDSLTPEDASTLSESVARAADAAEVVVCDGITAAMNRFNSPPKAEAG
jgi:peptidyl-tRNA hydrolase